MYRNETMRFSLICGTHAPFVCRKKKSPR